MKFITNDTYFAQGGMNKWKIQAVLDRIHTLHKELYTTKHRINISQHKADPNTNRKFLNPLCRIHFMLLLLHDTQELKAKAPCFCCMKDE